MEKEREGLRLKLGEADLERGENMEIENTARGGKKRRSRGEAEMRKGEKERRKGEEERRKGEKDGRMGEGFKI